MREMVCQIIIPSMKAKFGMITNFLKIAASYLEHNMESNIDCHCSRIH